MNDTHASSLQSAKSSRLMQVLILGALSAMAPLSIDMYLPALPILTGDLHTSASLAQLTLTACLLGL
ncbi:MAG: MFS transporter, partial [Tumebacillaceae bacterium]